MWAVTRVLFIRYQRTSHTWDEKERPALSGQATVLFTWWRQKPSMPLGPQSHPADHRVQTWGLNDWDDVYSESTTIGINYNGQRESWVMSKPTPLFPWQEFLKHLTLHVVSTTPLTRSQVPLHAGLAHATCCTSHSSQLATTNTLPKSKEPKSLCDIKMCNSPG